jgi:hypothetical protein
MAKDDTIIIQSNFNSQDILNMALGTFISKQMISILKSSKSITASQIFKLIAILSLDEIRINFMKMIKKIFGILGENYLTILQYIDKYILKNIFVRSFKYLINYLFEYGFKPLFGIKNKTREIKNEITIKLVPTLNFMKKFIQYIKPENYKIDRAHNIKLQENNMHIYKQTWFNIKTSYNMIDINLSSDLILTFEKLNCGTNLIKYNTRESELKYNTRESELNLSEIEIELVLHSNKYDETELYENFNNWVDFINGV